MKKLCCLFTVAAICFGDLCAISLLSGYTMRNPIVKKDSHDPEYESEPHAVGRGSVSVHAGWVFESESAMIELSGRFYPYPITERFKVTSSLDIGFFGIYDVFDAKRIDSFSLGFTAGVSYIAPSFEANLCLAYSHLFAKNSGKSVNVDVVSPMVSISYIASVGVMLGAIYKHNGVGLRIGYAF